MTQPPTTLASHISSPALQQLVDDLASASPSRREILNAFWSQIEHDGTPLLEPTDHAGSMLVTWLFREEERRINAVGLIEPFGWKPREQCQLRKLDGTDVWYLTWRVRDDLRGSYEFLVRWADAEENEQVHDTRARHFEADDWGNHRGPTAVIVMPNAQPLPWWFDDETVSRGTLHAHDFRSEILGNERPVWVHTPHGYNPASGPYPYMVVFDGEENHSAPRVIDNLVAAGKIPPLVAILVNQIEIRDKELPGNPDFSRAIATELVPWMREEYHLSSDAENAILNGRSFGGMCSAYTALRHPDVFGNAIMQSASCWVHPNVTRQWAERNGDMSSDPVGEPADIPLLIQEFRESERKPIRIWQEVGTVENGPPPARIWQTFGNRWLHDILELKGYDTHYREYVGGHDDAWWRGTLAEGLMWVFGEARE